MGASKLNWIPRLAGALLLLLALFGWAGPAAAAAQPRLALVIANSAYQTLPALPNADP